MKDIFKTIGLLTLIGFSFFYTEEVMNVIKEQDPIMIKLNEVKDNYIESSLNAQIIDDTIIPGKNGTEIDLQASYQNMKQVGTWKESLLEFTSIKPEISISDNLDKYLIKGNETTNQVSLVFTITSDLNFNSLIEIATQKQVPLNLFLDYKYLNENISNLKKLTNLELYTYADNGNYTPDILIFSNNLIERISNPSRYCLTKTKNTSTLSLCSANKMHTILPHIITTTSAYSTIKTNLQIGDIILLEPNKETINELPTIIDFIKQKGLEITTLSELLSE